MWSPDLYARALDFAAHAHGAQRVPGTGLPYTVHLAKVAAEALRACVEDPSRDANLCLACALLHDTLEDTATPYERLVEEFGDAVARGVRALTKNSALPKHERMTDCLARLALEAPEVRMVKLADRITNLEPPPPAWSSSKRAAYRDEAREIARALHGLSAHLDARIAARIEAYGAHVDAGP